MGGSQFINFGVSRILSEAALAEQPVNGGGGDTTPHTGWFVTKTTDGLWYRVNSQFCNTDQSGYMNQLTVITAQMQQCVDRHGGRNLLGSGQEQLVN